MEIAWNHQPGDTIRASPFLDVNEQDPAIEELTAKLKPELKQHSAIDALEAEMKLLHWHKLANDAALKAALIQTKSIRQKERTQTQSQRSPHREVELEEKIAWMKQIIEEEQSRPLQVSKDFVLNYEQAENQRKERLDNEINRHVMNLKQIRKQIDTQVNTRERHHKFREWKTQNASTKRAIMEGRIVKPSASSGNGSQSITNSIVGQNKSLSTRPSALNTVLESLSKLEELEHRITVLEHNKQLKQVVINDHNSAPTKATLQFKRKRVDQLTGNPARAVYTVRIQQGMTKKVGPTIQRQPVRRPVLKPGTHIRAEKFLNTLPNLRQPSDDARQKAIRAHERQMIMSLTTGQQHLRNRIKAKQKRSEQERVAQQRHRTATKAAQEKRTSHVQKLRMKIRPAKGASAGVKYGNKQMNDFNQIRIMHQRRRDVMNRMMQQGFSGPHKVVHKPGYKSDMLPNNNLHGRATNTSGRSNSLLHTSVILAANSKHRRY